MEVDPTFHAARKKSRRRILKRRLLRASGALVGVPLGAFLIGWVVFSGGEDAPDGPPVSDTGDGDALVQSEGTATQTIVSAAAAFIDLPGDPLILRFDVDSGVGRQIAGPSGLDRARVGPVSPDRLTVIEDRLIQHETRLLTVLPSTRRDFALFQSRQSGLLQAENNRFVPSFQAEEEITVSDSDVGGLGQVLESGDVAERRAPTQADVENTISVAVLRDADRRSKLYEDIVVALQVERALNDLLTENGFSRQAAERISGGTSRYLPEALTLGIGSIVALRFRPDPAGPHLLQLSLYENGRYVGSMAQTGPGRFSESGNPWLDQDLVALSRGIEGTVPASGQQYRLLDVLYSAAVRNGLPTDLVGELIVMMAQAHDLEGFAQPEDEVRILFAPAMGDYAGSLLYIGVRRQSGELGCYVIPSRDQLGEYRCFDPRRGTAGRFAGGLVLPVRGWPMSSPFGPRYHPVHRVVRDHNGVDWAAPTGTPVLAAADGKVVQAGVAGSYGNLVVLDHGDGLETRYAHLSSFAVKAGTQVRAGDPIGAVGSTGVSTGPHLHFELRLSGLPVDPMTYGGRNGAGLTASVEVEALTERIIRIESAGVADARNPNSTATGLGQFIETTWLRMMRTYRPDLYSSMSREDLLALRTNPSLSRDMVQKLARENEAYLLTRGHAITPGRLYLAHFLGAEDAHKALSAAGDLPLESVVGAQVVAANRFLAGYTVADLLTWADRKMGSRAAPTAPVHVPPEVQAFKRLVDQALATPG